MGEAIFPKDKFKLYEQTKEEDIEIGDLIMCSSSGIHNWTIGFLIKKGYGFDVPWVIKEIDGSRLCNISNDSFYKIPKEWIPDEYLITTEEYKIYEKCIKAINKCDYSTLYKGIKFEEKTCILECRQKWSSDTWKQIKFEYNSKTTIKSIVKLIEDADEKEYKMFYEK